jgi:hypothetical protein
MTLQEQYLYHQVHPLKLLADWSAGLLALRFFRKQELWMAVVVAVVPPLVVSGILIRFASLEHYATSKRGEYIKTHMTRARRSSAPCRYVVMAFAAWYHLPWMMLSGLLIILLAWFAVTTQGADLHLTKSPDQARSHSAYPLSSLEF